MFSSFVKSKDFCKDYSDSNHSSYRIQFCRWKSKWGHRQYKVYNFPPDISKYWAQNHHKVKNMAHLETIDIKNYVTI